MLVSLGAYILSFIALVAPPTALFSGNLLTSLFVAASIIPVIYCIKNKTLCTLLPLPHIVSLVLLLAVVIASATWSIVPEKSWQLGFRLLMLCILGYSCTLFATAHVTRGYFFITLGNLAALALIAVEYNTHGYLSSLFHPSQTFQLSDLNKGATFLALSSFITLSWLMQTKRWIFSGIFWLAVLLAFSHLESLAALAAFIAATGIFAVITIFPKRGFYAVSATIMVVLVLTPILLHAIKPEVITARIPSLPLSAVHRLYIWEFASHKADEHPFLGWGASATRYIEIKPEDIRNPVFYPMPVHPHNQMLQLRFDLGLPGIAFFIAFIGSLLYGIRRSSLSAYTQAAAVASIAAYLIIGGLGYSIWHSWWISNGFLIAAYLASTVRGNQMNRNNPA